MMKKQTLWMAFWMLMAMVGQADAFAQEIRIDMNKTYPEKTVRLQEVADVQYIPLGTTDDMLFNGTIVNLADEGIAGFNPKQGDILVFDGKGKPVASFNRMGEGPDDYPRIYHLDVDWKQGEIYVQDNLCQKIRVYTPEGNHLRTVHVEGKMKQDDMFHFSDTHLIYYKMPENQKFAPYQPVMLLSKKDGSVASLDFTKTEENLVKATGGPFGNMKMSAKHVGSLNKLGEEVYVNEVTDDVIYRVENPGTLTPFVRRTPSYRETVGKDFFLMLTGVNARYDFFKRQQALLEFQGNAATDTKSTYVAYDRRSQEVIRPTFVNDDYPSLEIPLSELMQGAGQANRCFLVLEAFKRKEALEEGQWKGAWKVLAGQWDEEDNPVRMVVQMKQGVTDSVEGDQDKNTRIYLLTSNKIAIFAS